MLYIFLITPDEEEKYAKIMQSNSSGKYVHCYIKISNLFDSALQLINTKPMIESKLKELLSELKKSKVQTIFVLDYKKRNDCKIFRLSAKLIASDSNIDEKKYYYEKNEKKQKLMLVRIRLS